MKRCSPCALLLGSGRLLVYKGGMGFTTAATILTTAATVAGKAIEASAERRQTREYKAAAEERQRLVHDAAHGFDHDELRKPRRDVEHEQRSVKDDRVEPAEVLVGHLERDGAAHGMTDEDPSALVGVQFVHEIVEHRDLRDKVDVLVFSGRIAEVREVDADAFDPLFCVPLDEFVKERRVTAEAVDHEHLCFLFALCRIDPVMEIVVAVLVVLTVGEGVSILKLQPDQFRFCHNDPPFFFHFVNPELQYTYFYKRLQMFNGKSYNQH